MTIQDTGASGQKSKRAEINTFRNIFHPFLAVLPLLFWTANGPALSHVIREKDKPFIVDRLGERWEVTQAESIGLKPEGFQYGLGKYAFTPLDDSYMEVETGGPPFLVYIKKHEDETLDHEI